MSFRALSQLIFMAIRHTYLKTRLVRIIMSYCSSPYRVCFSPKYNKESQSPLLYSFPEMEKQTVLPIHTSRPKVVISSRGLGFLRMTCLFPDLGSWLGYLGKKAMLFGGSSVHRKDAAAALGVNKTVLLFLLSKR